LRAEFNDFEVAKRIAGLALQFDKSFLREFGAKLAESRSAARGSTGRPATPLYAVLLAKAILASANESQTVIDQAFGDLATCLETQAELFLTVMRLALRAAHRDPEWRSLPDEIAVPLIWVFADITAGVLVTERVDPIAVLPLLDQRDRDVIQDLLNASEIDNPWAVAKKLTSQRLCAAAISEAFGGDLPTIKGDILRRLRRLAAHPIENEGRWLPRPDMLFPLPQVVMPAGFWPFFDSAPALAKAGFWTLEEVFSERSTPQILAKMLGSRDDDPHGVVPFLFYATDLTNTTAETRREMRDQLLKTATRRLEDTERGFATLCVIYARIAAHDRTLPELRDLLIARASILSRRHAGRRCGYSFTNDDAGARDFAELAEAAFTYGLTLRAADVERLSAIAQLITAIADAWPGSVPGAIRVLDQVVRETRLEAGTEVWPILLSLRGQ
jgi:hypothetical protein